MKTSFSEGKLMKQFGNWPPIFEQFFHYLPLSKFQKQETYTNFRGGRRVAGMKATFLVIFDPTYNHILTTKDTP